MDNYCHDRNCTQPTIMTLHIHDLMFSFLKYCLIHGSGHIRKMVCAMICHWRTWTLINTHRHSWTPMDTHGHLWTSMDLHGHAHQWTSMDIHGYPWTWSPMDLHGPPWTPTEISQIPPRSVDNSMCSQILSYWSKASCLVGPQTHCWVLWVSA